MKWANLAPRFREHAHKLRQALASAVELHLSGKWGRPEIETAGLRDYARVFGHAISPRTFWRSFDRTLTRVGPGGDFRHLEHYLPAAPARRAPAPALAAAIAALPNLAQAIGSVANITQPTPEETIIIWDAACVEWQRLGAQGLTARQAQKRVLLALAASGLDLARNERALRINFIRKRERWIEGGYTPAALRDQRPESSGHRRELPLTADDGKLLLARSLHGGLAQAWRQARNAGILSAAATQAYLHEPASKSYVPHRVRDHLTPNLRMLDDIHHGPRQAALQGAYISRDWSDVSPGDWYSADDTTLPLYYWEENEQGRPQVLRGQCLVMNDCRTGRLLAFALHSERNYTAKVIRGLILKVHDTYGLPRRGFFFERGTWASAKLLKGAGDEVPGTETELGLREWVEFRHAQPGNARAKTVERIIGLLQNRMEDQPGYCGRNEQVEKFERLRRRMQDVKSGRLHPREFLLHRDEWAHRLQDICEAYNQEAQEGRMLKGLSPREAWDSLFDPGSPLVQLSGETRYLLANHRRPLKVSRNGLCVQLGKERIYFRNETTGRLIGRTVQVYFNPEDLSSVFVKITSQDRTAAVIPAAPVIPAMSATREQLHAALASVEAHNRPALTLYREITPHFPQNAPSPFRRVVADAASVELGQEITADQEAVRRVADQEHAKRRQLARQQRKHGAVPHQDAISADRQMAGYQLLEEAQRDAD